MAIGILAWASCALATDFYVSSTHPSRNDRHTGTRSSEPWATFDKVRQEWGSTIRAGDTVHLERGSVWTWTGDGYWYITTGGNASRGPITITSDYGAGSPAILAKTGGNPGFTTFWISASADYITLRDFIIDGGSQHGVGTTPVYVGGPNQSGDIEHIDVINMTMRHLGNTSSKYICGIYYAPYNNHAINNCLVQGNDVSGYTAHGLNHYPERNGTHHNGVFNNMVWRDNRVHSPARNRYTVQAGLQFFYGGRGNVVEYNYFEGPNKDGSIFIGNAANHENGLVVRYNVVRDNTTSAGINITGSGTPASTLTADIYGNIVTGCYKPGLNIDRQSNHGGTLRVCNNTFYDNNQRSGSWTGAGGEVMVHSDSDGMQVAFSNNLLAHHPGSGSRTVALVVESGFTGSFTHHHNLYWNEAGGSPVLVHDRDTTYTTSTLANYEASGLTGDPQFTSAGQLPASVSRADGVTPDGLSLPGSSPAIDGGAALGDPFTGSIDGPSRPQGGAWDIGAYENVTRENTPGPPDGIYVVQLP